MCKGWILAPMVAGALLSFPATSQESPARLLAPRIAHGNRATFNDPTGDARASADIATVTVLSDDRGFMTFQMMFVPRLAQETTTVVYLDSDRNPATGDRALFGADYAAVVWDVSASSSSYSLRRWNGRRFKEFFQSKPPLDVSLSGRVLRVLFDTSYLGRTSGGNFVVTTRGKSSRILDKAPDAGKAPWSFDLVKVNAVELSAVAFETTPRRPSAGQLVAALKFKASSPVDLMGRVDVPSCKASLDGKPLAPRRSSLRQERGSADVTARCAWRIPHGTSGKLFRGSVTVTYGGRPLTRSFSLRITR